MNKTVKIIIIISAVFFAFASSGFTPIITIEPVEEARPAVKFTPKMHSLQAPVAEQAPAVMQAAVRQIPAIETQAPASVNFDSGYFNPLAIPELKAPVPRPPEPVMTKPSNEAVPVFDNSSVLQEAPDPRMYYSDPGKHKDYFVPASEARPPERSLSIPVVDNTIPGHFDMNEYEEDRFFSSNLYTDTAFYNTHVKGDKELSSKEKGSFYDINYRYELFSTSIGGDSLALNVDATYTNSKRAYEKGFTLNHFSLESDTERSRLVFGDAYPDMSRYSFTQGIVGAYGVQQFDYTSVSAFAGYHALNKDDMKNPRYVGGMRLEHSRDESFKVGFNFVGVDDKRDNAGADLSSPTLYSRIFSVDARLKPIDNIYIDAEIARSDTDFDKRASAGRLQGNAYRMSLGYKRQNLKAETGFEKADTEFAAPLGETPRDEQSVFARFYYELNRYISGKAGVRSARDNISNYLNSTIKRDETEFQLTVRPSEYYKNMRFDFYYRPVHEHSETAGFMDVYKDMYWLEFNNKAGKMLYYMSLAQTIDRDEINMINDSDSRRFDISLTWEYDRNNKVYGSYGAEDLEYKRANLNEKSRWIGFGGASRFDDHVLLTLDYKRENLDPNTVSSIHDTLNLSLTREYSKTTSVVIDLEGNRSEYANDLAAVEDYTAKLRLLRAF
ncbi:MAG: hypothetical protein BWY02_01540 [bacterium ADurb.Bin157]|nr:hypothetical protein [Candidatus Riflebacteria bacterium]OQB49313.1 MAG: hypothetical protein BWY02_01540 [bacterium ADurb.Bin157]